MSFQCSARDALRVSWAAVHGLALVARRHDATRTKRTRRLVRPRGSADMDHRAIAGVRRSAATTKMSNVLWLSEARAALERFLPSWGPQA